MLYDEVKKLEEENEKLKKEIVELSFKILLFDQLKEKSERLTKWLQPDKIYHTKSRRNTTVVFEDGSSVTVKLKKGERHCLETALAYAIMKHMFSSSDIKELLKSVEEK